MFEGKDSRKLGVSRAVTESYEQTAPETNVKGTVKVALPSWGCGLIKSGSMAAAPRVAGIAGQKSHRTYDVTVQSFAEELGIDHEASASSLAGVMKASASTSTLSSGGGSSVSSKCWRDERARVFSKRKAFPALQSARILAMDIPDMPKKSVRQSVLLHPDASTDKFLQCKAKGKTTIVGSSAPGQEGQRLSERGAWAATVSSASRQREKVSRDGDSDSDCISIAPPRPPFKVSGGAADSAAVAAAAAAIRGSNSIEDPYDAPRVLHLEEKRMHESRILGMGKKASGAISCVPLSIMPDAKPPLLQRPKAKPKPPHVGRLQQLVAASGSPPQDEGGVPSPPPPPPEGVPQLLQSGAPNNSSSSQSRPNTVGTEERVQTNKTQSRPNTVGTAGEAHNLSSSQSRPQTVGSLQSRPHTVGTGSELAPKGRAGASAAEIRALREKGRQEQKKLQDRYAHKLQSFQKAFKSSKREPTEGFVESMVRDHIYSQGGPFLQNHSPPQIRPYGDAIDESGSTKPPGHAGNPAFPAGESRRSAIAAQQLQQQMSEALKGSAAAVGAVQADGQQSRMSMTAPISALRRAFAKITDGFGKSPLKESEPHL